MFLFCICAGRNCNVMFNHAGIWLLWMSAFEEQQSGDDKVSQCTETAEQQNAATTGPTSWATKDSADNANLPADRTVINYLGTQSERHNRN